MSELSELTARQKQFVEEYVVDHNITQAAIRAGYSPKTAGAAGSRLLKQVKIMEAVRKAEKAVETDRTMSAQEVRERLAEIARATETGIKDKLKALELIGKTHQLYVDRIDQTIGGGESPVVVKFEGPLEGWSQ